MRDAASSFVKGFCIGAADVVPGVSGGTMAFILGIYRRLIDAIRAFDTSLVRLLLAGRFRDAIRHVDVSLLAPLTVGIFAALLFFTRVVPLPRLIESHPELVYGLFFGLIVASIVVLIRSLGAIRPREWVAGLFGVAVGFGIVNLVPVSTPDAPWFIALSGTLAISAMLVPGISGSFVLLILRKYAYVFDGIGRFDPAIVIPFGIGVVVGLVAFSRVLAWLIREWYRVTLLTICVRADRLAMGCLAVSGAPFPDRGRRETSPLERSDLAGNGRRHDAGRIGSDGDWARSGRHGSPSRTVAWRDAAHLRRTIDDARAARGGVDAPGPVARSRRKHHRIGYRP